MSLKAAAKHIAAQGRNGDSMLVHMTPREVAGLQALARAHGTSLTVNPQTGLPEAFNLDSLASSNLSKGLMTGINAYGGMSMAEGGVTRMAEGGNPYSYVYDPVLQRYVEKRPDAGLKSIADPGGLSAFRKYLSEGSEANKPSTNPPWDAKTPAERAAWFAENPTAGKVARFAQDIFGSTLLGKWQAEKFPDFVRNEIMATYGVPPSDPTMGPYAGLGDYSGYTTGSTENYVPGLPSGGDYSGYTTGSTENYGPGLPSGGNYSGYTTGSTENYGGYTTGDNYGQTAGNTNNDVEVGGSMADPGASGSGIGPGNPGGSEGGGWGGVGGGGTPGADGPGDGTAADFARGGLSALAGGGISHLGDYSDGGRLLRGPGDGVSDSIPATIGQKRPARLADGEFVVPARIVSELGNGSTEAGARKLYAMMDRVQKNRSKTVGKDKVAVNSRADKYLPA